MTEANDNEITAADNAANEEHHLIAARRAKLTALRDLGHDPFGGRFVSSHSPAKLSEDFAEGMAVQTAGRMTSHRDMGKSHFFDLSDATGKIQCYVSIKALSEDDAAVFSQLDVGDWLGVTGETFLTRTGEPSIKVKSLRMLSKALRPLPEKWHGLADMEARYRQRYLDLIANEESRRVLLSRSRVVAGIRDFFHKKGYIEVETPMLQMQAGGAAAQPFETHHRALNMPLFMRIAPELFLKRLLVGGMTKVFELNRNFRNEGISRRHNPEFTMLEAYEAFGDFESMAELVEELVCGLAENITGSLQIECRDEQKDSTHTVNLQRPWRRARYADLIKNIDADWFERDLAGKKEKCTELGVELSADMLEHEITQQVFEKLVEEKSIDPIFVTHLPAELVPLAKACADDTDTVEVFELIVNGFELAPGYTELNDPDVQRQRLLAQIDDAAEELDEAFLLALEHGMPPAGGIGLGIDRLVMLLTGSVSIRDVILFPQLRKG